MEIRNDTPYEVGLTIGMGPDRKPCLAVIVKATFKMPVERDGRVEPAETQLPVLTGDEYIDGDISGSILFDTDTAPFKPRADVLMAGTAYSPGGRPVKLLDVMLRVGRMRKIVRVYGNRKWLFPSRMVMVPMITDAEPFTQMPLIYEKAFGGFDDKSGKWCKLNYVGKGFIANKTKESVDGRDLPNLEDPVRPISSWDDEPTPVGFGVVDRGWQPRGAFGGSLKGMEQAHPLFGLAADFQHAYYNVAPPDQQVAGYLQGNEEVEIVNATPNGTRRFRLPGVRPTVTFGTYAPGGHPLEAAGQDPADIPSPLTRPLETPLDTLMLLPDENLFYQVWRGRIPLGDAETMEELEAKVLDLAEIHVAHAPQSAQTLRYA